MSSLITRWDPINELREFRRLMDPLTRRWPATLREEVEVTGMDEPVPVDIFEKGDNLIVKAALPGVNPKDIDVSVKDGVLQISAETRSEEDVEEGAYHRREYHYGRFSRSFRLPADVNADKAQAKYENGMLRLTLPRSKKTSGKPIKVEIG